MEKLAVVAKISALESIEGADKIERASVLGWHVVVAKGQYSVGDTAVMVFPDTLIPKKYLDSTYTGDEKVRLKTVKLKGQYSSGLLIPADAFMQHSTHDKEKEFFFEGDDVSVHLGIEKWVAPASSAIVGEAAGNFPTNIISKTDEYNIRSEHLALDEIHEERFKDQTFVATLKCDGTSGTFIFKDNKFTVCSRNLELKETEGNAIWQMAKKYKLQDALSADGKEYAIQGEICGPGVQANPMKLSEVTFFAFLLKDVKTHTWVDWDKTKEFCEKHGIPTVEELYRFNTENFPSLDMLQEWADNARYDSGRTNAEGIVIRTVQPMRSSVLQKSWWSLKVMNQPYDMKKG
jgi:RNA ligase (TIGR02306 family)